MGNKTSIGWTHRTMNPIKVKDSKTFHCVKRSPACDNCYAEVMARRLAAMGNTTFYPYKVLKEMPELELNRKMLASWKKTKKPYLNFVTSMTDLFGEFVPKEWIFEILDAMVGSKQVFQCLTKREDIMMAVVNEYCELRGLSRLPENIWMGITVESQKWYDKRINFLIRAKVSVRWLSMEPLLGPVDLYLAGTLPHDFFTPPVTGYLQVGHFIHWVVVGGESGFPKDCRPTHPDWFRSIRDQCRDYDIPFFFKQWGCWAPVGMPEKVNKGHFAFLNKLTSSSDMPKFKRPSLDTISDMAEDIKQWRIGGETAQWMKWGTKKAAGEQLDGVEHKYFPEITELLLANE